LLSDAFCAHCGQRAGDTHLSLRGLLHELVAEHFGMDTKVARTLAALVRYPGRLTLEFLAGRRVRYVPPLRLYVSLSVLFFLASTFAATIRGSRSSDDAGKFDVNVDMPVVASDTSRALSTAATADTTAINPSSLKAIARDTASGSTLQRFFKRDFARRVEQEKAEQKIHQKSQQPAARDTASGNAITAFFKHRLHQRLAYMKSHQGEAGTQISEAFRHDLPDALFLLVPGLALALAALYYESHRYYAEHLVFALHFQAFSFAALTVGLLPIPFLDTIVGVAIVAYLFLSLRRVYGQGVGATIGKLVAIAIGYVISLTVLVTGVALTAFLFA
jgi:uncharacterized protein DUF3667